MIVKVYNAGLLFNSLLAIFFFVMHSILLLGYQDVIQYLEKCFGVGYMGNQSDNGNAAQQHSLNQGTKASTMSNASVVDASGSDSGASANINENSLSGTLSDDALEYENLFSTLDSSGQNLGRPSNDLTKASADRAAPAIDLKLKMHLYKVRLLLLTRNLKAAKREVKLAMNMARGRDSSTELLLKSQLEYARGNHRKAVKLLMTSGNRTEPGMLSIFNNNLGCIHYQLRSHHISGLFFSKALKNSSSLHSEKPLKLSTFSQDKSLLIIYNCGIQNLACGKPLVAAKCFGKASLIFYNRPLLWLRLAECCLLALEKGLLGSASEDTRVHVAGSGRWRQLVVDDLDSRNGYYKADNSDEFKLSLPFARYCLQNALLLLNKIDQKTLKSTASITALDEVDANQVKSGKSSGHKNTLPEDSKAPNVTSAVNSNGDSKENKGTVSSFSTLQSSVASFEDMRREENHMIKQAVLGALAYVELCLENPLKALSSSKSLLDLPECSKIYVFLGHIYAAEALCWLNRSKEAAEHLSVYLTDGSNVELPYTNEDKDKWSIKRGFGDCEDLNNSLPPRTTTEDSQGMMLLMPEEARGVALVNFSALFAMQGDLEKASRFASEAVSLFPKHPKALLAAVYLDLLQERTHEALSKLKQFSHVRYLSTNVTVR